jgi:hypothetical protein
MILNIHLDASYFWRQQPAAERVVIFFMGWMPKNGKPICLNGAFHTSTIILRFIVASAAEAELGALYHNCQTGIIFLTHPHRYGSSTTKKTHPL